MPREWCHEYGEQARSVGQPRFERLLPVQHHGNLVCARGLAAALEGKIDRDPQQLAIGHRIAVSSIDQGIGLCPVNAGKGRWCTERD